MVTATPAFPQTPKSYKVQLTNSDGTLPKNITAGGSAGSKISSMTVVSTDSVAHDIQIGVTRGGTFFLMGTVNVGSNAGNTNSAAAVDLFGSLTGLPTDSDGNDFILLTDASDALQIQSTTNVTLGTFLNFVGFGADF